jgi:hypothetical protein
LTHLTAICVLTPTNLLFFSRMRLVYLLALLPSPVFGAFTLVENFDSLAPGALNGQNGWTAGTLWSVAAAPTGGSGNAAAGLFSTTTTAGAYKFLGAPIPNASASATLFFRIRRDGAVNTSSGLSDDPAGALFGAFEAQLNSQSQDNFNARDAGVFDSLGAGSFANMTWYNVWMVVNNSADTYQLWIDPGSFGSPGSALSHVADPNGVAGDFDFSFRNGAAANPLNGVLFAIGSDANSNGTFYVDDIYVDTAGQNLVNPVPEPSALVLLGGGAAALGLRRRCRSQCAATA